MIAELRDTLMNTGALDSILITQRNKALEKDLQMAMHLGRIDWSMLLFLAQF
jgi:hypothetical protein